MENLQLRSLIALAALIIVIATAFLASADNDLQCTFIQSTTCPANTAKLVGVQNDTGGWDNAHIEDSTTDFYAYSLCCNDTNSSIAISTSCTGSGVVVVKLNSSTNSHAEIGTGTDYGINACLNSSWEKVSCAYPTGSCSSGSCIMSLAGSEGTNTTNAHVSSCSSYDQKVCCGLINNAPTKVTLWYPANTNTSVFERTPNFNWTLATDPESDAIHYDLNVSCACGLPQCSFNVTVNDPSQNYIAASALPVDVNCNWTVDACDTYGACNLSTQFNFTVKSVQDLVLTANNSDFGSMALGENKITASGSTPSPITAMNNGNVILNVTVNASELFTRAAMDAYNYQYNASDNESGSLNLGCSQTGFAFMDNATSKPLFCNLSYVDSADSANLNLNITTPTDEPAGIKNSTIYLSTISTESY